MASQKLRLLGQFELLSDSGSPINGLGAKPMLVLAYLGLSGGLAVRREELIRLFWPDRSESQARASLRQLLWSLRKTFEGAGSSSPLVIDGDCVSLDFESTEVDVTLLESLVNVGSPESLARAVSLVGGELLHGTHTQLDGFEQFLRVERERIHKIALKAFRELLEQQRSAGQIEQAIDTAQGLLRLDPVVESAHRDLMQMYAAQEEYGLALKQYRNCCEILERDLGVGPETETEELRKSIETARVCPSDTEPGESSLRSDQPVGVPPANLPGKARRWWKPLAAGLAAAAVGLGMSMHWNTASETRPAGQLGATPIDIPTIAVLPFENLSGDPGQDYLVDGLTDDVITDLSRFKGLFVIAGDSSFRYRDRPAGIQDVAHELGVRYLLKGTVQWLDSRIRINTQLVDARSGQHLWAERYERSIEDLFVTHAEIIEMIVATLALRIDAAERQQVSRAGTEHFTAYSHVLAAHDKQKIFTPEAINEARELLETAIEIDPGYARAYGMLAFVYANLGRYGWTNDTEGSLALAVESGRKAVALRPDDYHSHWALGRAYKDSAQFDRAAAEYDRALELNANDASLLAEMVELLVNVGRAQEGVAQIKLAMRINPLYPEWYLWNLGWAQYFTGDYEEALEALNRMSNPPNGVRRTEAAVLVRLGRRDEAKAVVAEFRAQEPGFTLEDMARFSFKHREDLERWMADLRTAGMPE